MNGLSRLFFHNFQHHSGAQFKAVRAVCGKAACTDLRGTKVARPWSTRLLKKYGCKAMLRFRTSGTLVLQGVQSAKIALAILYAFIVQVRLLLRNGNN